MIAALDFLHKNHIVHGDIKCANVLMTDNYDVKICDFGLATVIPETQSVSTKSVASKAMGGTYPYLAPELVLGTEETHTKESDVFALGVVLWAMLERKKPFYQTKSGFLEIQRYWGLMLNRLPYKELFDMPVPDATKPEAQQRLHTWLAPIVRECRVFEAQQRPTAAALNAHTPRN